MQQQVRRYVTGALGFGFVVAWATLGAKTALVAVAVCVAAANLHRLRPRAIATPRRTRPGRSTLKARPLREERDDPYQLVPDDPSLVISATP